MLSAKNELLAALAAELEKLSPGAGARAAFESPKVAAHGDFACTAAMQLAKPLGVPPRELGERLRAAEAGDCVRLLAPFDPVVWDRRRFELFWGWAYRFEAYSPAPKRVRGYYALPLLWRDAVIGWGNLSVDAKGALSADLGYVAGRAPREAAFKRELEAELERMRVFLGAAD